MCVWERERGRSLHPAPANKFECFWNPNVDKTWITCFAQKSSLTKRLLNNQLIKQQWLVGWYHDLRKISSVQNCNQQQLLRVYRTSQICSGTSDNIENISHSTRFKKRGFSSVEQTEILVNMLVSYKTGIKWPHASSKKRVWKYVALLTESSECNVTWHWLDLLINCNTFWCFYFRKNSTSHREDMMQT